MSDAMPQPLHPEFMADYERCGAPMECEVFPVVWRMA